MRFLSFAVTIGLAAAGGPLLACSCGSYPTTCASLASAKIAFVATVLTGTEPDEGGARRGFGRNPARVRVERVVRGLAPDTREIQVNPSVATSCYFPMLVGERWLVLGVAVSGNVVMSGGCTGSRRIPAADTMTERMVLSYLEGPNLFFGSVRRYKGWDSSWRTDNLLEGVEVQLVSEQRKWSATTGTGGDFEVTGLPPGPYRLNVRKAGLSPELDTGLRRPSGEEPVDPKIEIPVNGCVEAPILMWPDQEISGTVRGVDGQPVAGVTVRAYQLDGEHLRDTGRSATTDAQGHFRLSRLMNGAYVVGVNAERNTDASPYRRRFHPAASSPAAAKSLVLEDKSIAGADIALDAPRREVEVRVRVVFTDETPAGEAMVSVASDEKGSLWNTNAEDSFTNANGELTLKLFDGDTYELSATWEELSLKPGEGMRRIAGPFTTGKTRLVAGPGVKVTLSLDGVRKKP